MIRAAFFDIDGTLKPFTEDEIRESTVEMLAALQEKGIRIFLATGRPPIQLPLLGKRLNSVKWDGLVMMNGQYCMDENRECFFKNPIPKAALESLVPWLKEHANYPCTFMELDYSYDIAFNLGMYQYLKSIGKEDQMTPIDDPVRSYTHDTYQICPYFDESHDAQFIENAPGMKSARWAKDFADMIPADGGKPVGIQKTLERFGIDQKECIAFGDGGNDIDMLKFAGIGVAMGNAGNLVKESADYVTDTAENDGILIAFRHFGIL